MSNIETYRLLLLAENQNESERLISLFRNAGHATRAHRITSEQDLLDHLDDHEWDLFLCDGKNPDLNFATAVDKITSTHHDIPCVVLSDNYDTQAINEAFEQGAQDIVKSDNETHLLVAVEREIRNARVRRERARLETELAETSQRAQQLLTESNDAIAFVADGMHIEANEAYAEAFGFEDKDDLDCLPIIDLIAAQDQDKFKALLRHHTQGESESAELGITGLKADGSEFSSYIILSHSSFDGEPCTQVLLRDHSSGGSGGSGPSTHDEATGLYNRYYLEDQIATTAVQVANGLGPASLILFKIDNVNALATSLRPSGCESLLKDLAEQIQPELTHNDCLTRYGDYSLALVAHSKDTNQALEYAQGILKKIEEHICEIKDRTIQYTCCAGISSINTRDAVEVCDNALDALFSLANTDNENQALIYEAPEEVSEEAAAETAATVEDAIEQDRFRLLFQPIVSLRGDSREHYEVLLRMLDGDGNEVLPTGFLSGATDTKLDRWVILESTKQLSEHRAEGHDTRLIINLTGNALQDESLVPWIGVALKAANLPADAVIFQFNEAEVAKHLKAAKETTNAMHNLKIQVSVGQFGRTMDPIKLLKHIHTDIVKIDGSFTLDLQENQGDPQVLKAMVGAISAHEIKSIVPCVENAGVLATLWQLGVHYIQGHYLQAPSPKMNYEFTEIA